MSDTLEISRFAHEQDSTPRPAVQTWDQLVGMLHLPRWCSCTLATCGIRDHLAFDRDGNPKGCRHKYGAAWSPAKYADGTRRRKKENVVAVSLLAIDVDHATESVLVEILGKVQRYRYIAHATHSDRPGDRCVRIALALSRPVTREEWPRFWRAAMRTLGVPADTQCCDANRLYFLPSRPSDSEYMFQASSDGDAIDVEATLASAPAAAPARAPSAWRPTSEEQIVKRARAYLERMPPAIQGQNGSTALYNAVAHMMFGFVLDEGTTRRLIADEYNPRCDPPWSEREIEHKLVSVSNGCERERGYLRDAPPPHDNGARSDHERPALVELASADRPPDDRPPPDEDIPPIGDEHAPAGGRKPRINPVKVARHYVADHATHPDGVILRKWRGDFYRWSEATGCYVAQSDEQIDRDLYCKSALTKRSDVSDVRHALIAIDDVLIDELELGAWIGDAPADASPLDVVACRNGLLHLPSSRLIPATPRYFTTTAIDVAYDLAALAPTRWLAFLRQLWPDDDDAIGALQEWIGYLLTPDTRQQKIAMVIGPKRSGKGTIGRVIGALLGARNVAAPTLASLGTNFGKWPLIGKPAAIIGDARLGSRSDIAQVVEGLLSISGEDPQTIDRKHREPWNGTLPTRITIISNELPRFSDASDALPGRMLMLELKESWFGREDTELSGKLIAELPGILMWAIEGWHRLRARGHFVQPSASKESIDEMADLASPVGAWARQRCTAREPDQQWWIRCDDAYRDFTTWCDSNGHHKPSQATFGRDVRAATGCHRKQVRRAGDKRENVYAGLALRTDP